MIKKITVKGEFRNRTYLYEVEDGIDFFDAVKKASADFVNTPDGRKIYYKKGSFSWNDFASVPEYICRKYGLRKLNFEESIVKNNESLISQNTTHPRVCGLQYPPKVDISSQHNPQGWAYRWHCGSSAFRPDAISAPTTVPGNPSGSPRLRDT